MSVDEMVINHVLTGIASGATKSEVRTDIAQNTNLRKTTIDELLVKALNEGLSQGIKLDEIDPSWRP
jgi:hypothetical protein